ncbi:GNAT family N-acetyltransferase [Ulvibacter antarcticus]|uniref:Acetyltransferase (GNAT) family protein n=1 Tax=Ulvibacter antarcticus TaxID=442714 RepID=A0A3L9ZGB2_9FLAO|nr:GNAT family N-acetyltransferase [Ulvibacter antarcticus]RMA65772.1 acetyltransferase (GNAT) family protein [Ulvibacter antarcticus]
MITFDRASTEDELQQILQLQKANLPSAITSEEKENEGFVTVVHDLKLLKAMNDVCQHIIAKESNKVVGYALCMHPKFGDQIVVLKPMFAEIFKEMNNTNGWIVMGQICIDKAYRKQGIFRGLYSSMQQAILPEFTTIVTEVDASNVRSLNAHYGVGFKTLTTYEADGKTWALIYLD